jgi:hypothetical protein
VTRLRLRSKPTAYTHQPYGLWRSLVSALVWGTKGRGFESRQPDHEAAGHERVDATEGSVFQQISSRSRMRGPQVARKVVGIGSGRVERIARTLAPELAGGQVVSVASASVDYVGEWRAAARKVARTLGEPIRTGITADGSRVWAMLLRPVADADLRDAARVLDERFAGLTPKGRTDDGKPGPSGSI